ncbi:MAG: adenylate/guanylate cyclase domain-containing protein [Flavobacteriales bacterium]|nr:adenylate/guanylate cyclase domain-containing protein [Flavobacteriales bacterium]
MLFTDFKGFTQASELMSPQELVAELNTCFKAFDNIITARGIEKIKTIGDAFMCVGGLPDPGTSSPADVVHAALEMQVFMMARKSERDAHGLPAFEMRVGIHSGPVVAGIVGVRKFQYDIWGDTVNTC